MAKMNHKTNGFNGSLFTAGGDSTNGPGISLLNEMTQLNQKDIDFMNLVATVTKKASNNSRTQTNPPPAEPKAAAAPPPNVELTIRRNPEEIAKQMQAVSEKPRRPLLDSQETIESYRNQVLELKLKIHRLKQASGRELENLYSDEDKQDLVDELLEQNASLKRQLEELKQKKEEQTRNVRCQTNLDLINMEDLIKASVTLKRQEEQGLVHRKQHMTIQHHHHQPQQQQQQTRGNQFNAPTISNRQLLPDEKELLESLYKVDGCMTTILDKLKAISNTH